MKLNVGFICGYIMMCCGIGLLVIPFFFTQEDGVSENTVSLIDYVPGVIAILVAAVTIFQGRISDIDKSVD